MKTMEDDTLLECAKNVTKNSDIFHDDTDMEMYFKDSVFLSNLKNKSDIINETVRGKNIAKNRSRQRRHEPGTSGQKTVSQKNSKLKINSDVHLKKDQTYKLVKENIGSDHILREIGLSVNAAEDTKNVELSQTTTTSSGYKSSEINHSILTIPTQDRCKLAAWGLPKNILQKYEARGVANMFPWQVECLSNQKVLEDKYNLVYSAPTSAGKTLVAEILMIKTVLERRKKVIFILPFVSVVREKMYYFQDLLADSGVRVDGFMGSVVPPGGFASTHIAIATIEKANSLVNRLMEEKELVNLGAVVIDELHLVGDPHRGYLLELLLTKLKYMTLREEDVNVQLIGMSATLPNLPLLAEWLNAELYKTEFRPVPLNEQCKIGKSIYDNRFAVIRNLSPMPELTMDGDNILQLCIETISDGHSVLIFCPTKNWCEKLAIQIAAAFFKLGREDTQLGAILKQQLDATLISETLEQLKRSPSGLDSVLKNTVSFGISFHHAGLTMDERDIIEGSFRSGSLRVLVATSTLSSGVNLPARRVIIRSPMFGSKLLDNLTYRQMIGRAGRMGKDTAGESILVCRSTERKAAESLLSAPLNPIESCLKDSSPLIRALLEAIASEVVFSPLDLELYTKCTLVSLTDESDAKNPANEAIEFLIDHEFLLLQKTEEDCRWVATALGKACLAASIQPKDGLFLLEELQKARRCFVLDTELHVIYLVTPLSPGNQIQTVDWMTYLDLWKALSESERRVGQLVGVEERFLTSAVQGIVRPGKSLNIHRRFYTALALHDLVRETPLNAVCKKYGCCRGILQSLQQSASTFAGMVTQFCKQLGWDCIELLVSQFQTRLQFGVCRELLDLLRLPMLNGLRARSLYKQGITCVAELALANELDVERALYKAIPFESEKEQDGEHESEAIKRHKMRTVFVTGRDGLTPHEAAIMLVHEARQLVQNELKLQDMSWKPNDQSVVQGNTILQDTQRTVTQSKEQNSTREIHQDYSAKENIEPNIREDERTSFSDHKRTKFELSKIDENNIENSEINPAQETTVESKNDHSKTVDRLLQSDFLEVLDAPIEKLSFDFFEDSPKNPSPKNRRNSQSLIGFKGVKRKNPDETESNKISSRVSESPNLFDESLNLDTQVFNVLEENIDTLNFSEFEETRLSKVCKLNEPKKQKSAESSGADCKNAIAEIGKSDAKSVLSDTTNVPLKLSPLTWKEDSWNESKVVMKKLETIEEPLSKDFPEKMNIRKIKNTDIRRTLKSPETRNCTAKTKKKCEVPFEKSVHFSENIKKLSRKPRFKEIPSTTQSPIANVIAFGNNTRRPSLDLNKSDSDEIIIASQNLNTPAGSIKIRSKLDSERKQRIYTQKISKSVLSCASESKKIAEHKIRPKLCDLLPRSNLNSKDFDGSMSISDEDSPVKSTKPLQTASKISLKTVEAKSAKSFPKIGRTNENLNDCVNWKTLNIIKVGSDRGTFNLFKRELMHKKYIALALSCEFHNDDVNIIGSKVVSSTNGEKKPRCKKVNAFISGEKNVCGAAISWEKNIAYYISFYTLEDLKVSGKEQVKLLKELLSNPILYVKCFATKEVYRTLYECCGISPSCKFLDPIVANWLYDGNVCEKSFNEMVTEHFPEGCFIAKRVGSTYNIGPGLNIQSSLAGEFRASAEAVVTWHITDTLLDKLEQLSPTLRYTYKDIEMRIVTLLARMELTGLGVCLKSLQDLSSVIREELSTLQERAYALCGRKFNFSSSKEVGEILGLFKGKKVSVNKAVLGQSNHPISSLVMSWRKLNATQSKIVYPLLKLVRNEEPRIHGTCVTCTLTGRVSMHEPNLQNVPKDFNSEDNSFVISVRMAFVPATGNVLLSADYCQLELRILAHFSKDSTLCGIMRKPGDIFKNIAAKWNHVSENEVDDKMRQHTKQLCYGMIYGMGTKTLAENLSVDETTAKEFLESFMNTYPGIRKWLDNVLEEACKNGYVTTLLERRRVLPGLSSAKPAEKSQAERQAINTKVQGSAADIAKKAMVTIEDRLNFEFPQAESVMPVARAKRKLRSKSCVAEQEPGYLVLQMHDELLYEVNMNDLQSFAIIVKESMENACQLTVPLPVKVKVGSAWGDLSEYNF